MPKPFYSFLFPWGPATSFPWLHHRLWLGFPGVCRKFTGECPWAPGRGEGSRTGLREELGCDAAPTQASANAADPMGLCTLAMTHHCMWAALGRGHCLQLRVSPGERLRSELSQAACVPAVGMSTQSWGSNPQHHSSTVIKSLLSSEFSSWKVGAAMHGHLFSYILTHHCDLG